MLTTPVNDLSKLFTWEATLFALEDSPFVGVVFNLMMYFTPEYPLKLPKVHFQQEVFHPNVHKWGISLDILRDQWIPAFSISDVSNYIWIFESNHVIENIINPFISYRFFCQY